MRIMPSDLPTRFTEIDLDDGLSRRVPSPGRCIYCGATGVDLTHEHALPLALAGHTLVIENSCCKVCQAIIQPYEQDVLKKQLGTFRAQVEAPTRRPKDRATTVTMPFEEVDDTGRGVIRDLGSRTIPIADAPLMLNLWASPPPRILLEPDATPPGTGQAWSFCEREVAHRLNRKIAEETGANHVRMKIGTVNRLN